MARNEVFVTTDLQDARLWHNELKLTDMHWINGEPDTKTGLSVRTRYRAELLNLSSMPQLDSATWHLTLHDEVRALTPGQSAVIYQGGRCLGGGIVI